MFDDPSGVWAAGSRAPSSNFALAIRPGFVVAIPVKDEEERLPACLRALAQQCGRSGQPLPGGWCASSCSPTIAPIKARVWLGS